MGSQGRRCGGPPAPACLGACTMQCLPRCHSQLACSAAAVRLASGLLCSRGATRQWPALQPRCHSPLACSATAARTETADGAACCCHPTGDQAAQADERALLATGQHTQTSVPAPCRVDVYSHTRSAGGCFGSAAMQPLPAHAQLPALLQQRRRAASPAHTQCRGLLRQRRQPRMRHQLARGRAVGLAPRKTPPHKVAHVVRRARPRARRQVRVGRRDHLPDCVEARECRHLARFPKRQPACVELTAVLLHAARRTKVHSTHLARDDLVGDRRCRGGGGGCSAAAADRRRHGVLHAKVGRPHVSIHDAVRVAAAQDRHDLSRDHRKCVRIERAVRRHDALKVSAKAALLDHVGVLVVFKHVQQVDDAAAVAHALNVRVLLRGASGVGIKGVWQGSVGRECGKGVAAGPANIMLAAAAQTASCLQCNCTRPCARYKDEGSIACWPMCGALCGVERPETDAAGWGVGGEEGASRVSRALGASDQGWLAGWLTGWLAGWLGHWLQHWPAGWLDVVIGIALLDAHATRRARVRTRRAQMGAQERNASALPLSRTPQRCASACSSWGRQSGASAAP
eukprot:365051-Chlamydomonas_euryale.AAC.2